MDNEIKNTILEAFGLRCEGKEEEILRDARREFRGRHYVQFFLVK